MIKKKKYRVNLSNILIIRHIVELMIKKYVLKLENIKTGQSYLFLHSSIFSWDKRDKRSLPSRVKFPNKKNHCPIVGWFLLPSDRNDFISLLFAGEWHSHLSYVTWDKHSLLFIDIFFYNKNHQMFLDCLKITAQKNSWPEKEMFWQWNST